jgi:hypothetical protein
MKKLITIICAACTLALVNTSVSIADSSNFAGPYIGITGGAFGAAVSGSSDDGGSGSDNLDQVSVGQNALATGIEAGYVLPIGSLFLLDVGASRLIGDVTIKHKHDGVAARGDVSFTANEFVTAYIAPSVALSDTSSLYVKWGYSAANAGVTGDLKTPGDLRGETFAIGTRTVLDSGIFIRTEAGYTEYNAISTHGKGIATNPISVDTAYSAEPTIAYGQVSLGFRF